MMIEQKFYFDTAIFIYALEQGSVKARDLLRNAIRNGDVGTSIITVMEYYTGCFKHNRRDVAERFRSFLLDYHFEIRLIDENVAKEAAEIRARYLYFKPMDALQIAAAKIAEASILYTNDKQLLQYQDMSLHIQLM